MSSHVDATFFVQIEPEWGRWFDARNQDTAGAVAGAKAVAITQNKPSRQRPGTVLAKLTVRVPKGAFVPLRPEAVIVIPEDMLAAAQPVEVEAGDPEQ